MSNATHWTVAESALNDATIRTALLWGPPGTGKTYAALHAGLDGRDVIRVPLTEETPAAEVRGFYGMTRDGMAWIDGSGMRAWRTGDGMRIVLDEIGRASGDTLSFLLALCDSPDSAIIYLPDGSIVKPGPRFQAIATSNDRPEDLPEALRDRFALSLEIPEPHPKAIESLPEDLRDAARNTITAPNDADRITLRAWQEYACRRSTIGADNAARAIFGFARGPEVLASFSIGAVAAGGACEVRNADDAS